MSVVRLLTLAVCALVTLTQVAFAGYDCAPEKKAISFSTVDGVTLRGEMMTPCGSSSDKALPAVVFLNPLGQSFTTYEPQATAFAEDGYRTMSFDPRGWKSSGGRTTLNYPFLVKDVQTAIDWLMKHYATTRIGLTGISEGGAMSMLTGAADGRVSAIASLSGWTNIVHPSIGNTPRLAWNFVLGALLFAFGKPIDLIKEAVGHAWNHTNPEPREVLEASSPWFHLDEFNAKRTPILLVHEMDDTLFPINQTLDFHARLEGPKYLQINRGFHAASSITVIKDANKEPWASVHEWFNAYVRDERTSDLDGRVRISFKNRDQVIDTSDHFRSEPPFESYYMQQTLSGYQLSEVWTEAQTSTDLEVVTYPWNPSHVLTGIPLSSALKNLLSLQTVSIPVKDLKRPYAIKFTSAPYEHGATIRGIPTLKLRLTSPVKKGLIVAHLVDVSPDQTGKLITHGAYTWSDSDRQDDGKYELEMQLYYTAWRLDPGHQVAVVLNSIDYEYQPPTLWRYSYKLDQDNGGLKLSLPITRSVESR